MPIGDNRNSLKGGERGPSLLEDFILREKITHFDHERIPERIVHARGSAAHGVFRAYKSFADVTMASFLAEADKETPVFARFSTVAGGAGSSQSGLSSRRSRHSRARRATARSWRRSGTSYSRDSARSSARRLMSASPIPSLRPSRITYSDTAT